MKADNIAFMGISFINPMKSREIWGTKPKKSKNWSLKGSLECLFLSILAHLPLS